MNALIIGSGAREHALAWKLRQSPRLSDLFVAPGNTGTAGIAHNLRLSIDDADQVVRACRAHKIDLVVVGNEAPLAAGLVDRLDVEGIATFGPTRAAAEIEWSKAFAKALMKRHGIPTGPFETFDDRQMARTFVERQTVPLVVKADGLALGKGVTVTSTRSEALEAIDAAMEQRVFGSSGARVLIEERLQGREVSAHAFTDGKTVRHMPFSCDHKPVFDRDAGPNTGGMGAYSPAAWLGAGMEASIRREVTEAAVEALASEDRPFNGVLYPGVMVTEAGPKVIEFNSRFGDPEAQVLLPRLESDLLEICWATANNRLESVEMNWSTQACVGVVLASAGYPSEYATGQLISGLDDLDRGVMAFHAGTSRSSDGALTTAGGRVLTIVATGSTLAEAREVAYRNIERVSFEGMHYRRDIGASAEAEPAGVRST